MIMKAYYLVAVVLVPLVLTASSVSACSDSYPIIYCKQQKDLGSCNRGDVQSLCRKTCEACGSVVPTNPPFPTLPPKTKGPFPPLPTGRPPVTGCGVPKALSSRVIAGNKASQGAWPWQIRLLKNGRGGCGGTLISPFWVVTASHCVSKDPRASIYEIEVGSTDLNRHESSRKKYSVSRVIMHPSYSARTINNDITLIKLSSPVQMNAMVQPACLPKHGEQVPVGTTCYITGFGKTTHPGRGSKVMMQAILPVVSEAKCRDLNTKNTKIPITDSMICAGHGPTRRESGCHGDSGGPFVCKNSQGAFTLHGAVSWGSHTCSSTQSYTVFARVAHFRNWIDRNMMA